MPGTREIRAAGWLLALAVSLAVGCGQKAPPAANPAKPPSAPSAPTGAEEKKPPEPAPAPAPAPAKPPQGEATPAPAQGAPAQPAQADKLRRVKALVSGRVQGVGFRAFTNAQANRIGGLTGYVRNLKDGRVEAVIEGPDAKVEELIKAIRTGPSGARVEGVELEEQKPTGEFKSFAVTS
jgi:acylphosphatase